MFFFFLGGGVVALVFQAMISGQTRNISLHQLPVCTSKRNSLYVHVCKFLCNTVDGRNPAPPEMYTPVNHGVHHLIINFCKITSINNSSSLQKVQNSHCHCGVFFVMMASSNLLQGRLHLHRNATGKRRSRYFDMSVGCGLHKWIGGCWVLDGLVSVNPWWSKHHCFKCPKGRDSR